MGRSKTRLRLKNLMLTLFIVTLAACGPRGISDSYHDPDMDFAALRTIAVMPFANFTNNKLAADRVRDTFMTSLMSTGVVYVIPPGEVARGISRATIVNPTTPTSNEITRLSAIIRADAVITGVVREYGMVRSGTTSANVISLSMQLIEKESGKVVWTASTTKGGISIWDRLFGGGGQPIEDVTEAAVNDIINKLFY
jgi:hypothetical protein